MEVSAAYDARAWEYADRFASVDHAAPADRATIESWAAERTGPVLDAGCGPGHWTDLIGHQRARQHRGRQHQARRHLDPAPVVGLDASEGLLDQAARRFAGLVLVRGRLEALPFRDAAFDGVLAWFSLVHTPPDALATQLAEVARVLRAGGSLLLGLFDGPPATGFDHAVAPAWTWTADALAPRLVERGLAVVGTTTRHDAGHRPVGSLTARRG